MKSNLTKRFIGLIVSLAMILAYAVPFAFAEGGVASETLWVFDSLADGSDETLTSDTDIQGLTIHATDAKKVVINPLTSTKKVDGESFNSRAKLGGQSDSAFSYRSLSFTPAEAGKVIVYYAHASSSGDDRTLNVVQGSDKYTNTVSAGESKSAEFAVSGGTEVFIGSLSDNLNVFGVKYVPDSGEEETPTEATDAPTEATDAPAEATDAPAEATTEPTDATAAPAGEVSAWYAKASDGEALESDPTGKENTAEIPADKNISGTEDMEIYANEALLYKGVDASFIDADGNAVNKPEEMVGRLTKNTQSGTNAKKSENGTKGASLKIVPKKNGTLSVYAKINANKVFYINDAEGNVALQFTNETGANAYFKLDAQVEAGKTYYAYTDNTATDFFGIELSPAAEATTAPTDATTAPTGATDAPASNVSAWYAKAADGEALAEADSNGNTAMVPTGKNLSEGTDIAVYVMEEMPYKDVEFKNAVDTDGNAVSAPNGMTGRLTKKSGGTNPTLTDNGASGASLKVVPSKNGTISAYVKVNKNSTNDATLKINDASGKVANEFVNTTSASIYLKIDAQVTAGTEYYIYTPKSGTDFFGVEFTPETEKATQAPSTTAPTQTTSPSSTTAPAQTTSPSVGSTLPEVTADTTWTFDKSGTYTSEVVVGENNDLKIYGSSKMAADGSNKTIGGVKYDTRLKLGGTGSFNADGSPNTQVVEFNPGVSGTLTVAFAHASASGDTRPLLVRQNGVVIGSETVEPNTTSTLVCAVAAGSPVYIYSGDSGLNLYAIIFKADAAPTPTADPNATQEPTADPSATATPKPTADPNATPTPVPEAGDLAIAQADADALTLKSISDELIYIDLDLAKTGSNGSTITWESSNEKYVSIQSSSSANLNYVGVVTRPTTDEECDETGGVPVTITAKVTYKTATVEKVFNASVRKYNPVYKNDFQADVGEAADEDGYTGIQDNVAAANGRDTFRGIRLSKLSDSKSMFGFENEDHDVEKYFDKRIMSTDSLYGKNADVTGEEADENFALYMEEHTPYSGGTTYNTLYIKLSDENSSSGYPEGIVIMSMDIYTISPNQKFNLGIATSKPNQMCRFVLNNANEAKSFTASGGDTSYYGGGSLRYYNDGTAIDYLGGSSQYLCPTGKWVRATIVANSNTHLWDLYFDGMQVAKNLNFRNAQDYIPAIEFTMDRDYPKDKTKYDPGSYLIDNISVENITDDYNEMSWENMTLELPYDEEKQAYTADSVFRLQHMGIDGLTGQTYTWISENKDLLTISSESVPIDEITKYGYTEEEAEQYKKSGISYLLMTLAQPNFDKISESGEYVTIKGMMEINGTPYSKEFKIFLTPSGSTGTELTDAEKAKADLNAITGIASGSTISKATTLDLDSIGSKYSSDITWKSSDSSIISSSGKVTLPSGSSTKSVILTATAKNGDATETKTFTVYVKGKSSTSGGGGGGGSSSGSSSGGTRVLGTVSTTTDKYETSAYTPEETSKMIFNDIENVSWAKDAIESLYNKGIVSGYGNGLFAPNYSVTREQFVKMVIGALGIDTDADTTSLFSDVNGDEWYAPYIMTAARLGIVTGKDDGSFGVGESITRQDMAVMCIRALKAAGIDSDAKTVVTFGDENSISNYAKDAVLQMAAAGYLTGDENGCFNPLDTATRAQTAVVLNRIINK